MNKNELIRAIDADKNLRVVIASDPEGNSFFEIDDLSIEEFEEGPCIVIWPGGPEVYLEDSI